MSSNPTDILQQRMQAFIRRAPAMAGRYAVKHFQDNIRRRGGMPVNGSLQRFQERKFSEPGPRRSILIKTGNMVDSIRVVTQGKDWVAVGISQRDIARYARLHQEGGTVTVTPKMKKYFWAMYYKASGSTTKTKSGGDDRSKKSLRYSAYAEIWKAMALKKAGSRITIPKREFMRFTPDVTRGILREFTYEISKIINDVKRQS
jgi:phage gpG-like protein